MIAFRLRKFVISESIAAAGMALAFCAVFAFLVIQFARGSSATFDEVVHLPCGYSYLQYGDYRLDPEHPPLIKKLAAVPLLFRRVATPPAEPEKIEDLKRGSIAITTGVHLQRAWAMGLVDHESSELMFGHSFLYGVRDETTRRFADDTPYFDSLMIPPTATLEASDFFNDADDLLFWGRLPILLLGILLAGLVFLWAKELFGLAGAVLAIALFCFDPNFIAHSGLITTDLGIAVFMFGAVYFFWRTLRRVDLINVLATSGFVALAFGSKFTAVLLLPIFLLLALGRILSKEEWPASLVREAKLVTWPARTLAIVGLSIFATLFSYGVLWSLYDFRFCPVKDAALAGQNEALVLSNSPNELTEQLPEHVPGYFPLEASIRRVAAMKLLLRDGRRDISEQLIKQSIATAPLDRSGKIILFFDRHKLLPQAYLYGLAEAEAGLLTCTSFLRGEHSSIGFRGSYFLWTFVLKTPLITIATIIAALVFALWRRTPWHLDLAALLIPVGLYWGVSLASSISVGQRHLLPIYPFLYVMCGGLAVPWARLRSGVKPWIAVAALSAVVMSSFVVIIPQRPYVARVYPHYLAYFNELAGGPPNGYKSLVDSNLDWGQDLKGLKVWLDNRRLDAGTPFYLCYFGMADPRYHRIKHINVPGGYSLEPETPLSEVKTPCYFAISATNLQGAYFEPPFQNYYSRLLKNATLLDQVGYSIFIYYFPASPSQ